MAIWRLPTTDVSSATTAPPQAVAPSAPGTRLLAAFLLVYVVWGSNFLAIRYALETVPPFLLMGVRSFLAGTCLYVWARLRVDERPSLAYWRAATAVGLFLFLGGHGLLAWAQQRIPSGVAALGMATIPLWMILLDWLWAGARRPGARVWSGLALGMAGLGVLVGPGRWPGAVDAVGVVALLGSAFAWAFGSVLARRRRLPQSVVLSTSMQLLAGGLALVVFSLGHGEMRAFDPAGVSARSAIGFTYMVGASSILGFTAYVWLLRVTTPARAASYAFVNPLVAVLVGWAIGGEALTTRTAVAAVLIVAGVAAIVTGGSRAVHHAPDRGRSADQRRGGGHSHGRSR
jgi:drug/metabolite transporter (DMT)-like permease